MDEIQFSSSSSRWQIIDSFLKSNYFSLARTDWWIQRHLPAHCCLEAKRVEGGGKGKKELCWKKQSFPS